MLYFFHHGAYYEASEPCLTSGYFTGKETQSTKTTYTIICLLGWKPQKRWYYIKLLIHLNHSISLFPVQT